MFKVYHPIAKSFFELKDKRKQMPLFMHLLALFIYVFSIVMFTCIDAMYVGEGYTYNGLRSAYFAIVYGGILTLIRPFLNWTLYAMFFFGIKSDENLEKAYHNETDENSRLRHIQYTP